MNLLVLGANSEIGLSIAHIFAREKGADITLASRNLEGLESKAQDIALRYQVQAKAVYFDALDYDSHHNFYQELEEKPDGVVLAFGYLGNQVQAEKDFVEARKIIETNFLAAVSILEIIASDFSSKGRGIIIGISSVAGERGRQSNYIYGSAKGGLNIYLAGLRHRLAGAHVQVLTVLPGFVRTKMTQGLDLPEKLTADPEDVAADVFQAYSKNRHQVYSKRIFKYIMWLIRNIPEKIFQKTRL